MSEPINYARMQCAVCGHYHSPCPNERIANLRAALAAATLRAEAAEALVRVLRLDGQRLATTVAWVADGQGQRDGMVKRAKDDIVAWRAALAAGSPAEARPAEGGAS